MVKYLSTGVAATLSALADPTRLAILDHLAAGPLPVSALPEPAGVSMPAVMKHLQVLESCGLTASRKVGRVRTCWIRPDALDETAGWISERQQRWSRRLDLLDTYLQSREQNS